LNTDFGIKNERQDYKIGTVGGCTCRMGRTVKEMKMREYG
jgi:hypothetical protein